MRHIPTDPKSLEYKEVQKITTALKSRKKYLSAELQSYLDRTSSGRCSYCGIVVGREWVGEVEHYYPKSKKKYKPFSNDIKNFHWSCKRCNSAKGDHIDPFEKQMISPNFFLKSTGTSAFIWDQLTEKDLNDSFRYVGPMIESMNDEVRGLSPNETISNFDLNGVKTRAYLRELRIKTLAKASELHKQIKNLLSLPISILPSDEQLIIISLLKFLISDFESYFSSRADFAEMIRDNFNDELILIKACYHKLEEDHIAGVGNMIGNTQVVHHD